MSGKEGVRWCEMGDGRREMGDGRWEKIEGRKKKADLDRVYG